MIDCSDKLFTVLLHVRFSTLKSAFLVYAFNTIVGRRPLWANLDRFNAALRDPWLILGDFNNVLKMDERSNSQPVSLYEIRDFHPCCNNLGLVDTPFSGVFLTWTNNTTWLDRELVNSKWIIDGLRTHANFGFPGKLSDHSPCVVSLFESNIQGERPFKFFNMWALHEDFQGIVNLVWDS